MTRRGGEVSEESAPRPDLVILERQVYLGPNYWSYRPCVRLLVDLRSLEDFPSNKLDGFTDRLLELLPGLKDHTCSRETPGGFVERLREGTWVGHIAEHIALELQRYTGAAVYRGKTRGAGVRGQYNVIYGYRDEEVALQAGDLSVKIVNHLVAPDEVALQFGEGVKELIDTADRVAFGPSTQAILDEAASRDIPYLRLDKHSLVQLGQGVHQKRIRAAITSQTSWLAVDIASDKRLTSQLLANAGLPVPRGDEVHSEEEAVQMADRLGYPVAVKPADGNHGRGVSLGIESPAAVRKAFALARAEARNGGVIVETFVTGKDYRVLVIGGTMAALAERVPAQVVGDGSHTVEELVTETNRDPRRGIGHENVLTRIELDESALELLAEQGYQLDGVPPEGEVVKLRLTANLSTGGTSIDRTTEAHPENVEIAEAAARVVGLDVAGVDFVAPDITLPVRETGGAIVEVNAGPGFRMHTHPTEGDLQYVAKPLVDLLFPPGSPSRIPIVAVTGTNGKTTTVRMVSHILRGTGRKVGMTSTDGIMVDERLIIRGDASGPRSARMVLQNPDVDFAVFEVARGGLLREGLGYERHDVGVVLNVSSDHLGSHGIDTLNDLANLKRVVVEAVPRGGYSVLNADDPLVVEMRGASSGEVIWFSMDPDNEIIASHVRRDGWAVVLENTDQGEAIVIKQGARTMPLSQVRRIPATFRGRARMMVANALAATAAAHAAGIHLHDIRQGLLAFTPSYALAPGRLNVVEVAGVTVVVDYAHNPAGLRSLGEFVDNLASSAPGAIVVRRRIGVIAIPGDRRDQDMIEMGEIAADHFDRVIVREDLNLRGRAPGDNANLVMSGVEARMKAGEGRARVVEVVQDEVEAVQQALSRANEGDVVVLCVDRLDEVWELLEPRVSEA
jgi:cyanophycin synthetase